MNYLTRKIRFVFLLIFPVFIIEGSLYTAFADSDQSIVIRKDWKAEWSHCKSAEDCVVVFSGCDEKHAVNAAYREIVEDFLWKINGDPKTLNCVTLDKNPVTINLKTSCLEGVCKIPQK